MQPYEEKSARGRARRATRQDKQGMRGPVLRTPASYERERLSGEGDTFAALYAKCEYVRKCSNDELRRATAYVALARLVLVSHTRSERRLVCPR